MTDKNIVILDRKHSDDLLRECGYEPKVAAKFAASRKISIIANLKTIAKIAEDKRVRIELLPEGFSVIARAPVMGKGMVESKQIITYDNVEDPQLVELLEYVIDKTIEGLKRKSGEK